MKEEFSGKAKEGRGGRGGERGDGGGENILHAGGYFLGRGP